MESRIGMGDAIRWSMAEQRKLHDRFFKQAKAEGYAARSAYKLKQIQEKRGILKRNDRVIDLGR